MEQVLFPASGWSGGWWVAPVHELAGGVGLSAHIWSVTGWVRWGFSAGSEGRFLSVDPGRDWEVFRPQSFNLYAYVRGNPVNRWDPWGLEQTPGMQGCSSPEGDEACGIVRWWSEEQLARAVAEGKIKFADAVEVRAPALDVETRLWLLQRQLVGPGRPMQGRLGWSEGLWAELGRRLDPGPGPCRSMSFSEKFWLNFRATNASLSFLPGGPAVLTGAGILGSEFIRTHAGMPALRDLIKSRFGPVTLREVTYRPIEAGFLASYNSVAGKALVFHALELGVAIGSAYQAAVEPCSYFEGLR